MRINKQISHASKHTKPHLTSLYDDRMTDCERRKEAIRSAFNSSIIREFLREHVRTFTRVSANFCGNTWTQYAMQTLPLKGRGWRTSA